jgi:hypothetical protein
MVGKRAIRFWVLLDFIAARLPTLRYFFGRKAWEFLF